MGVIRHSSAVLTSRGADVDIFPYSGRPATGRQLKPKHTEPSHCHCPTGEQLRSPRQQLASPVLFKSNALSPGGISWASVESSDTGTSHQLARKRELSAIVYTPTSSTQASPGAFPDITSQNQSFWVEHHQYTKHHQQNFSPDQSLSPPIALQGLGLPLEEKPFNGPQAYPPHNFELLPYHTTSPPSRQTRPGVRWRPLSPDAKENAGAVRDNGGSCIRCFIMRERCDKSIPCNRCMTVSGRERSWKLPCTRQWLDKRGEHFLPHILTSQLDIMKVDHFINSKTFFPLEDSRLKVPLSIGFGQNLIIEAVKVTLIGPDLMSMHGFAPGLCAFSMKSPPIVPCWPVDTDAIYTRVRTWISDVLDTGNSEYPEICFPSPHPTRHRHILSLIHQYYHASGNSSKDDSCIVTSSLRLSVATYVMGHALTVPQSFVPTLFSHLRHPDFQAPVSASNESRVSPRALNRVVKSIICQLVRHLVAKTFSLLHQQLGPKLSKAATFESAFSSSFLLLTALAQIQSSLYERAIAGSKQTPPDPSFSMSDAAAEIHRMEDELTQYVVHLFLHRYRPKKKRNCRTRSPTGSVSSSNSTLFGGDPSIGSSGSGSGSGSITFREKLHAILAREKEELHAADRELSPDVLQESLFEGSGVGNVTRVLARLCAPLLEE